MWAFSISSVAITTSISQQTSQAFSFTRFWLILSSAEVFAPHARRGGPNQSGRIGGLVRHRTLPSPSPSANPVGVNGSARSSPRARATPAPRPAERPWTALRSMAVLLFRAQPCDFELNHVETGRPLCLARSETIVAECSHRDHPHASVTL